MAEAWSEEEVDRTVDAYFAMLGLELAQEPYRKADFRRELAVDVHRSTSSMEFKFQNISAVLDELGALWIPGYKPRRNVQQLLRERVAARYDEANDLRQDMLRAVESPPPVPVRPLGEAVAAPQVDPPGMRASRRGRHIDYAAVEERNRSLGLAGELVVVDFERQRLAAAGREDLADAVRHVSVEDGDGLGYDILSFDSSSEAERYIEVKTTRYSGLLPFHVSRNEVEFSREVGPSFELARVYEFGATPKQYRLRGALDESVWLDPTAYLAGPR